MSAAGLLRDDDPIDNVLAKIRKRGIERLSHQFEYRASVAPSTGAFFLVMRHSGMGASSQSS
jgi:hypothetical protein